MNNSYSQTGKDNLSIIDGNDNFVNWMFEQVKPHLHGNILEIGSGIGTYSKKLIENFNNSKNKIYLSELDKNLVKQLEIQIGSHDNISVHSIDLLNLEDFSKTQHTIDSIFALNVLEHIEADTKALNNIYKSLEPNGTFIMLIPAHNFLYNCIDKSIGHYRRYTKKSVKKLISNTEFKIEKIFYFNFFSIFGWYINGNIFKKNLINENAISLFNKFVPVFKFIETYILRKKAGISIVVVLKK